MTYEHTRTTDRLMAALAGLESPEEAYRLFEDLCTVREVQDMAQRLEIARLLKNGTKYQEVAEQTGVSTATISRVNRCLHYGAGGYQLALSRLSDEKEDA